MVEREKEEGKGEGGVRWWDCGDGMGAQGDKRMVGYGCLEGGVLGKGGW